MGCILIDIVVSTLLKVRILNNVFYNGAVQTSSILLNLLLMPYITRILGKEALGINSFGQAIAGYFVLLGNLGITIYGCLLYTLTLPTTPYV